MLKYERDLYREMLDHTIDRYIDKLVTCDWNLWDSDDVTAWICNLNKQQYAQYGDILLRNLTNEGVHGCDLPEIRRNDLYRFGIRNKEHVCDIYEAIHKLLVHTSECGEAKEPLLQRLSTRNEQLKIAHKYQTMEVVKLKEHLIQKDVIIEEYENLLKDMIEGNNVFVDRINQLQRDQDVLQRRNDELKTRYLLLLLEKRDINHNGNKNQCVMCMKNSRTYTCIPCGHLCMCLECKDSKVDDKCPICLRKYQCLIKMNKL